MTKGETDLQICPELGPCVSPIQVTVLSSIGVEGAVIVHDVDDIQAVPLADFVVVGVMGRGDLQGPCAKLPIHVLICNDTDAPVSQAVHRLATVVKHCKGSKHEVAAVHTPMLLVSPPRPSLVLSLKVCNPDCAYIWKSPPPSYTPHFAPPQVRRTCKIQRPNYVSLTSRLGSKVLTCFYRNHLTVWRSLHSLHFCMQFSN